MLLAMVTSLPRVLGTAWAAVQADAAAVGDAWQTGGPVDVTARALQVVAVVLPVLAGILIVVRIGRRWLRRLVQWSRGSVLKRAAAVGLVAAVATALSWAWAPRPGAYRPITPGERGLLTAVLSGAQGAGDPASAERAPARPAERAVTGVFAQRRLADGSPLQATFQTGRALPTRAHPRLAMVLVPTGTGDHPQGGSTGSDGTWVFPFDKPLPPGPGDNQAAAYNTTDGSVKYDVAFALVWATGDEVYNVNEAHAYASCSNCVTVAVAFQVVLIMDNAHVVVPQNLSVAANYECYQCITAAIASQLVLSVEKTPGDQQLLAIGELWHRLTAFGHSITSYSLTQISAQLEEVKAEIVAILDDTPPAGTPSSADPSPTSAGATDPPASGTPADPEPSGSAAPSTDTVGTANDATAPAAPDSSSASDPTGSAGSSGATDSGSPDQTAAPTPDPTTDSPTPDPTASSSP